MTYYIYFVKCPDCEDEPFDFFDQAKSCAMSRLGQKPIITQTAVDRNDFGECTNSEDLGTVWSWEEEAGVTDAEPACSIFTKGHFDSYADEEDPEFADLDNSVDYEPTDDEVETAFHSQDTLDQVPDNFRKPIPEGMTIEQLVEEMEENEDDVECKRCHELFDKSECKYDRDYGWLCSGCQRAVVDHGGDLVISQPPLDEDLSTDGSLAELVSDSINHLTSDLGKDPWADDFADDVAADLEANYDIYVPEDPMKYKDWFEAVACEVSRQVNNQ